MTRVARWLDVALLALGFCIFVPWDPLPYTDFYEYAMHVAFVERLQFGAGFFATYGPLGFIVLPFYHPETYRTLLLANVFLFAAAVWVLGDLWSAAPGQGRLRGWWIAFAIATPCLVPFREWDGAQFLPYTLATAVLLRSAVADVPPLSIVEGVVAALLGVYALARGQFIPLTVLVLGALMFDRWRRGAPAWWLPVVSAAAALLGWIAAGQRVSNVWGYLRSAFVIMAGAKQFSTGEAGSGLTALVFVLAAGVMLASLAWLFARKAGVFAVVPLAAIGGILFSVFQHGFTRAESWHVVAACLVLLALAGVIAPVLWRAPASRVGRWLAIGVLIAAACPSAVAYAAGLGRPSGDRLHNGPRGLWSLVTRGRQPLEDAVIRHVAEAARAYPLPKLTPPADCTQIDVGLCQSLGYGSLLRPTAHTYWVFNEYLSRANRAYLEDPSGPKAVVMPSALSSAGMYPTGLDAASFLTLRSTFALTDARDAFVVLERRPEPRRSPLVRIDARTILLNETANVPESSGVVWAQIDVQPTLAGRVAAFLYKPARVLIDIQVAGHTETFSLVPTAAREGMVLSPLVNSVDGWRAFYEPQSPDARRAAVTSFRISVEDGRDWQYRPAISVAFSRLEESGRKTTVNGEDLTGHVAGGSAR